MTSFWRGNDVIITSCIRSVTFTSTRHVSLVHAKRHIQIEILLHTRCVVVTRGQMVLRTRRPVCHFPVYKTDTNLFLYKGGPSRQRFSLTIQIRWNFFLFLVIRSGIKFKLWLTSLEFSWEKKNIVEFEKILREMDHCNNTLNILRSHHTVQTPTAGSSVCVSSRFNTAKPLWRCTASACIPHIIIYKI